MVQNLIRSTVIAVGILGSAAILMGQDQASATEAGQAIAQSADYVF